MIGREAAAGLAMVAGAFYCLVSPGGARANTSGDSLDPCITPALRTGALPLGPTPADFAQPFGPCAQRSLTLRLGGAAAIDLPDFYGAIAASGTLLGRWAINSRWSVRAALDLATYRLTANAVVVSTATDLGPGTLGVERAFFRGATAAAIFGRVLLPFDTARRHGTLQGIELGATAQHRFRPRWVSLGWLALPGTVTVTGDDPRFALVPAAVAQVGFLPTSAWMFSAGFASRAALAPTPAFRSLSPRIEAHLATLRGLHLALGAELRVLGDDRTDLVAALSVGYRHAPR